VLDTLAKPASGAANYNSAHYRGLGYDEVSLSVVDKAEWQNNGKIRFVVDQVANPNSWGYGSRYMEEVRSVTMKASDVPDMLFRIKQAATSDQGTEIAYYM
jgi:hypothetical protein